MELRRCTVMSCLMVALSACGAQVADPPAKIRIGMLRVGQNGWRQMGQATAEDVASLIRTGLNTVLLVYPAWAPAGAEAQRNWFEAPEVAEPYAKAIRLIRQTAAKEGVRALPIWAWTRSSVPATAAAGESCSTNADGTSGRSVCPIDPIYWRDQATARGVWLIGLGFDGVLLETEVYEDKAVHVSKAEHCFCEACLSRFLRGQGRVDVVPAPAQRRPWLEGNHLLSLFEAWQERELLERARSFAAALTKAKADVRLGYYVGPVSATNWYYRALSKGLSRPGSPIINMDEGTYGGQGQSYVGGPGRTTLWDWHRFQQELFAQWDVPVNIVHGIWTDAPWTDFSPLEVERFCFITEVTSDGYWFYNQQRNPEQFGQSIRSAAHKAGMALRDPRRIVQTTESILQVRQLEGYDVTHAMALLKRAKGMGNDPMAAIFAYQADWLLRK